MNIFISNGSITMLYIDDLPVPRYIIAMIVYNVNIAMSYEFKYPQMYTTRFSRSLT